MTNESAIAGTAKNLPWGNEVPNSTLEPYAAKLAGMNFEQLPKEKLAELVEGVVGELSADDAIAVVERAAARAELQGIMLQDKANEMSANEKDDDADISF